MTPRGARAAVRAATLAGAVVAASAGASPAWALPGYAAVRAAWRPSDVTLLDRHGVPVQTVRVDRQARRLDWVPLERMSPALLQALVLSEDRRFYEHSGVDWNAVAQSAWANVWNTRTRGASTLTMQLAGLLDADLARPAGGRSMGQKVGQAVTATRLERRWKKSQILEAYLNLVPFRGELVGVDALSQTLFGKHPSGLDAQEAAIASALLRAPNASPDVVARRACGVLELQKLPCAGVTALASTALVRRGGPVLGEQLAPHFARQLAVAPGAPVRTTLDARLQRFARDTLRHHLQSIAEREVQDGAVVVLDNASGEVRAWVGSSGDLSDAAQVDGVVARRQPGSTLKPFVYALAFERRLLSPASLVHDAPAEVATPAGLYLPQNYDRRFQGWVSARTALGSSLNVPAVRVGALVGPDALVARLNAFGLALPHDGAHYGPALPLGAADVTLLALTNAYRALANGGLYSPVALGPRKVAAQRVADPAAVFLVTDVLADNTARVRTFGLDNALVTRGFAAVKTGTSKDMRDSWCVGFTDRYTVGVWVGNADGAAMHEVSGVRGSAPVWQAIVRALHDGRVSRAPSPPPGVVGVHVGPATRPPRADWALAGMGAPPPGPAAAARFGIATPRDGSIFALDPDIPPAAQKIVFEGERGTWSVDGRRVGQGARVAWSPWPGRHRLSLHDAAGRAVQTVTFEVRGAVVKSARR